jgi:hypothetical protein
MTLLRCYSEVFKKAKIVELTWARLPWDEGFRDFHGLQSKGGFMKKLIMSLSLVFVGNLALAGNVFVTPYTASHRAHKKITFTLNKFKVDPLITGYRIRSGQGSIDLKTKKMEIVLTTYKVCPEGMMCATVVPPPVRIEMILSKVTRDQCGGVTYRGYRDLRPVDGQMQDLVVKDNTRFRCPTFAPIAPFEVTYKTSSYHRMSGRLVTTHSTMSGDRR